MAENMMNSDHKSTNKKYRDNYDRIFKKKKDEELEKLKQAYRDRELSYKQQRQRLGV
jgi:hypothetical protein